jgi:hypothetical protein
MVKYYACRVGVFEDDSHFDKTFHKPILEKKYEHIKWALNEVSIHTNTLKSINKDIQNGNKILVLLYPNKPNDYPYAICELNSITERNLGPLIALDETNIERGWINGTSSGYDDFKYDFKFSKIYLLKNNSFGGIKLKGQKTFFELKMGFKNEELLKKIQEEIDFIKLYVNPIICTF